MNKMSRQVVLALASTTVLAAAPVQVFENDANHSIIGFKAVTLLFEVPGRFQKYKADIKGNPEAPEGASVKIEIDAASVDTDNSRRDDHLRNEDFFDVKKYPTITFTSSSVKKDGGKVVVTGTLDMHGQKQELTIPFTQVTAVNGAGFKEWVHKGSVKIKRSAFKLGAESVAAKLSMEDEVELNLLLAGFFEEPKAAKK